MRIDIDDSFLTSVNIRDEWSMFKHIAEEDLTPDEVFKIIKGEDRCSSLRTVDHPEFARLRDSLEQRGFIRTQRNSWNGDYVTKTFTFNGARFKKGERFPCACAMRGHLKYMK